jgi:hypothetical protein
LPLIAVCLRQTQITDVGAQRLTRISTLTHFGLPGSRITDAGIANLGRLPLRRLVLSDTGITDAGIKQVARISTLNELIVGDTGVTDHGLRELSNLRLTALSLRNTRISDASMPGLARLPLSRLDLTSTAITPDGLRYFQRQKVRIMVSSRSFTKAETDRLDSAGVRIIRAEVERPLGR